MEIGEVIRLHRMMFKLTQDQLAERIHRDRRYIIDVEKGRIEPDTHDLKLLNDVFRSEVIRRYTIGVVCEPIINQAV